MSTVTLAESAKLSQDELVAGVIEDIITVNPFFDVLPFDEIEGNALAYNRENVLGDVQALAVGGTITAKNPATFTKVTSALTTIIGDAEVNGLLQATRSNFTDQQAAQVSSKAKNCGRKYQDLLINGSGTDPEFSGLLSLIDAAQIVASATNGSNMNYALLDALLDAVTSKDGEVDFLMMHRRTIRSYMALLRALGGASINEVVMLPGGRTRPGYRGVPIFANDWLPINQVKGTGTNCTTIVAGVLDDGSRSNGIAGLTARDAGGIRVKNIGESETRDETITRVSWYCGLACFSRRGLAAVTGILD